MNFFIRSSFLSLLVVIAGCLSSKAWAGLCQDKPTGSITPSHVYLQTECAILEIKMIRAAKSLDDVPREPGVQVKKNPIHVYGKCLEVIEKIGRAQSSWGITPAQVGQIPIRNVTPSEVYDCVERILVELQRIKTQLNISVTITSPPLADDKLPSHVYENMWKASYLLDAAAGQISPSYVYRNTQLVINEIKLIAKFQKISMETVEVPASIDGKTPKDVNLQGFKNLHTFSKWQRKLGVDPLRVSGFPSGNIRPSDVYDTTNNMLAELVRIKAHLSITSPRGFISVVEGKTPPDVFAQMQVISSLLKDIIGKS